MDTQTLIQKFDKQAKLKEKYPDTKIAIPGHGKSGGTELFDYTIKLFDQ